MKGKKLGFYEGSFNPIHLGHQHVIESCLNEGYVDYVLVYPAYDGDRYKNRTEHSFRFELIASVYHDHPSVLLTDWTPKELQDHFSKVVKEVEVLGIIGSDVVEERLLGPLSKKYLSVFMRGIPLIEKHHKDTIGGLMALKAQIH